MHALFKSLRLADDPEQRREYSRYLALQMGPMIHALMLVGTFAYLVAVAAGTLLRHSPLPLWLRLAPLVPLLLVASWTRHVRQPRLLSALTLLCILLLETGINLNGFGDMRGQSMVLPGLLLPVASSVIWLGRWDFVAAMLLCALGPLPMLLFGRIDGVQVVQYL
ncbi:MAG: GGDEF domain-containing protein, partial [Rhodanobacter sp.]